MHRYLNYDDHHQETYNYSVQPAFPVHLHGTPPTCVFRHLLDVLYHNITLYSIVLCFTVLILYNFNNLTYQLLLEYTHYSFHPISKFIMILR
jgi:hypothetical protein